jgi:glyoxylate reductase
MFALRNGHWKGSPPPPLGHDPQGKVLGILGMGGIGRNLMKKAQAFGMITQYYNRTELSEELSAGAKYVSFDELLATSDVLSLNLPLNVRPTPNRKPPFLLYLLKETDILQKQTRHIISTAEFSKMKKGVVIVNTARGAVIDEDALVKALDSRHVSSCGLDVYEAEPKVHPGLVSNPHVMLLPHMGTWTLETQEKMEVWCIDNVKSAIEKGVLMSPVGEQKDM